MHRDTHTCAYTHIRANMHMCVLEHVCPRAHTQKKKIKSKMKCIHFLPFVSPLPPQRRFTERVPSKVPLSTSCGCPLPANPMQSQHGRQHTDWPICPLPAASYFLSFPSILKKGQCISRPLTGETRLPPFPPKVTEVGI